jgi:succinoglycan biosynthesis transport protein ExoP
MEASPSTPDLVGQLGVLRRRKWSVLLTVVLVVAGSLFMSFWETPRYTSRAEVFVKAVNTTSSEAAPQPPNLETERELASSESVAQVAAKRLSSAEDPNELLNHLSVEVAPNTEILEFTYWDPSPLRARAGAQAFAEAYLRYRRAAVLEEIVASSQGVQQQIDARNEQLDETRSFLATETDPERINSLETREDSLLTQLAILEQQLISLTPPESLFVGQVVVTADVPQTPSSPNHIQNGLLALAAGLLVGSGVAFLRERLDDRLRGREELETMTGTSVLAVIPEVAGWKKSSDTILVSLEQSKSPAAEAYKTLRTAILFFALQNDTKVLLVTSAHAGEGKTSAVANLGASLAHAGKRVVVVAADLRKPRLHSFFGVSNDSGLIDVLAGEKQPWDAMASKPGLDNLRILPSGRIPGNPTEMLGSDAMGRLLATLRDGADFVLIDSAPLLAVADPLTLAHLVDGVLLIADAQSTNRRDVAGAVKHLDNVKAPLIGTVLNNFDPSKAGAYYGTYPYDYAYASEPERSAPSAGNGGRALRGGRARHSKAGKSA